jgi:Na+/melibiose symporter-like transporter
VLIALPWLAVHRATFERPGFRRPPNESFREGLAWVFRHSTFTRLTALYIMGRIAMDLAGALLILYTAFWLGRAEDFELVMLLFLGAVVLALPLWLALSRGRDKSSIFIVGALWWSVASLGLAVVQPDWPRWLLFLYVPLVGVGFAVVDLMPWSMLGEVIDEDEAAHGERREGIYNGVFTFIRKLGGAIGVFLVMSILDLAGFVRGDEQTETARQAVRWMAAAGPAFFLLLAVWMARSYPLTRERHREILKSLDR